MRHLLSDLASELEALREEGLERSLEEPCGIDFTSNDYLGLSTRDDLKEAILERLGRWERLSSPASRLLRGHTDHHGALEERLAWFKGTEAALLFPSGYQANLGVLTGLISPRDRVLSDALNHASLIDGLRLTRCHKEIYPHLDLGAIEEILATPFPGGRTFLVTESLFSMDGDRAPLDRYADLAERFGAGLIVDDAHATGLFGPDRGSGLVEELGVARRILAVMSTAGKALGCAGAFVAGPQVVIDSLINRSRPFLFTTALPLLQVAAIEEALELLDREPELRRRTLAQSERLRSLLQPEVGPMGIDLPGDPTPILPITVGNNDRARAMSFALRNRGFDVRAVRPPTVPVGSARIRISVHANHDDEQIDRLAECLIEALEALAPATVGAGHP